MHASLKEQFPDKDGYARGAAECWKQALALDAHHKSTRATQDAECFTFSATLRYLRVISRAESTVRISARETRCFVKFAWKPVAHSLGAHAEREIITKDIKPLLLKGLTPCLPLAIYACKVPCGKSLAAWDVYRGLLNQSESKTPVEDHMRRGKFLHLFALEACGDITLGQHLLATRTTSTGDVLPIFLMLFHALSVLARAGISHNDLHFSNIVVKRIPSTVLSVGGRVFRTSHVPVIIDWDMGSSSRRLNRSLPYYNYMGVFNEHNPLFDLYGVVKSLLWYTQTHDTRYYKDAVLYGTDTTQLVTSLKQLFGTVVASHPWLFALKFDDEDGDRRVCVQQTPYIPKWSTGVAVPSWPAEVKHLTPSFETIQARLHSMIEKSVGCVSSSPEFSFPPAKR
jgi:hypothetical protein